MSRSVQLISSCLWFDHQAEEAADFYTSLLENSAIKHISCYGEAGHEIHGMEAGTVLTVDFELAGQPFTALNGGPHFTPNPSISFFINCENEEEVDQLWADLSEEGTPLMPLDSYPFSEKYGWVQDRYSVSWQLILSEGEAPQKIMPSLLFVGDNAGKAEEAIDFYTSVFDDSKTKAIARYGADQEPNEEGTVMYADFTLQNQLFAAMDSAQDHSFNFNEAISLVVNCDNQDEVDYYWQKLSAHPEAEQCGWLKDRFGVSWQVVPTELNELLWDDDSKKSDRVMEAMLQMKKLDIERLKQAYSGELRSQNLR